MRVTEVRKAGRHITRRPERKVYDALDRIVETVLPGVNEKGNKRVQKMRYGITDEGLSYTETTDPKGNVGVQYADARGNIVKVERKGNDEKGNFGIRTSATYEYDAMGQMVAAYDAARNPITVMYDMLGRKTELTTKDGGAKRYTYDALHLLYEDDEVMRQSGSRIDYSYDGFNRVVKIAYPEGGDVEYEYGIPKVANNNEVGAKANAAGKVIAVRDEAGETRYEYGKLGEVVKETRTLQRHIPAYESEKTAVMEYVSDYLGRMQSITYPDREVVTYGYDAGGQVCSITGERDGRPYTYVADIRYDEYGQRIYIKYGNGVETNYTYDENMRWLKHIGTENKYGTQYQNINYSFDDVGNVLGYKNDCMNGARYSTKQEYTYDALYQLISATGTTEDNPYAIPDSPDYTSTYNQNFFFDAIGNMTRKDSKETITPAKRKSGGDDLNYDLTYEYDTNYAHRLKRAGSDQKGWRYYMYDANGNVTSESDGVAPNEDTTTLTPVTVTTHTNEEGESVYEADYAWAWPWSDSDTGGSKPTPRNKRTYEWNSRNLLMRSVALGYDTRYAYGAEGNRAAKWTAGNLSETLYFNTMWTWHIEKGLSQEQQGQYSKHIYLGETRIVTKQTSDLEEHYGPSEEKCHQYYYHPDHLGSAQLVTDYEGNEYQRIEYTPYGELWVEKKTANEKDMRYLPYKFTAKEQDEETGLYYYGARYLDAKYSRWLSADPAVSDYIPLAPVDDEAKKHNEKLPGQGGIFNVVNFQLYHYAGNNPVKYVDPTGAYDYIEDTKTINCDASDSKDIDSAYKAFALLSQLGECNGCTAIDPKTGSTITFDNPQAMGQFIENTRDDSGNINFEQIFSKVSDAVGIGSVATGSQLLNKISIGFTLTSTVMDGTHAYENYKKGDIYSAVHSGIDVLIDIIGLTGSTGTVVSIGLKYTKAGVDAGARELARFHVAAERYILNQWSQAMCGVDIKK